MNTYKIDFSKENNIGGAFDEYNQMVASIEGEDYVYDLKFRSNDFQTTIYIKNDLDKKDENYNFVIADGRTFSLGRENVEGDLKVSLMIDDECISDQLLDKSFTIDIDGANYYLTWVDKTQLELKTDSNRIVEIISIALVLLIIRNI